MRNVGSSRYGGIRFHSGYWNYGISFAEADEFVSDCAILLARNHRIVFGTRPTNGTYVTCMTDGLFNAQGMLGYGVNGVKVIGERKPAIKNSTAENIVETVNSILHMLRSHGLIET